ncbi:MAG: UDP-glucose 4-epimerase GalE [Tenericutes bacterium HGW-Tenericutes-1]|jgi:UDP-glucose 4-epimerase|nr:MAG: UDP-glucose 4-epimerase GalE [Tenericutes bacterium HGW-Tenericutes-1]
MNILVLGGAGYIGSHFAKQAIKEGHHAIVIDNLQTGHLKAVDKNAVFYKGDIRDSAFLDYVFNSEKIDACVHFAANSLVGVSMKEPLQYFDNNVYGTIELLKAMNRHQVKYIVFSSSAAVYGSHKEMPITEEFLTLPTNPYGESKLMMEKMMKWADLAYGMRFVSLRYFNVAGASDDHSIGEVHIPETHLIPLVLRVPLGKSETITVFGSNYNTPDGTCIRDYIHMYDLIQAHLLALKYLSNNNPSDIFNLGSNSGYSNLEVIQMAREITNHPIPLVMGDRRPGDPDQLIASNTKAFNILGWIPTKGLKDIITDAWAFHQSHPEGY